MKNWKYTNIHHAFRRQAGISLNEYAVLDLIYQQQTHPESRTADGWAEISYKDLSDFLGLSKGAIFKIVERCVLVGLMEVNAANAAQKRTLPAWYGNAYISNDEEVNADQAHEIKECFTLIKGVQKVNGALTVQKVNDTVQKVNDSRSKSERHTKEEKNIKRKKNLSSFLDTQPGKEEREQQFRNMLAEQYGTTYPLAMLNEFANYWTESNPNGKKMRFEMQKIFDVARRLSTWAKKSNGRYARIDGQKEEKQVTGNNQAFQLLMKWEEMSGQKLVEFTMQKSAARIEALLAKGKASNDFIEAFAETLTYPPHAKDIHTAISILE